MLSKSDFKKYLQCPFYLWLYKYRSDLLTQNLLKPSGKIIDEGQQVDELSRGLFENAFLVRGFNEAGWQATQRAMKAGQKVLIQPTVVADPITSRADFLIYDQDWDKWDIYEVKSSTKIKRGGKESRHESHIIDLAFQRICWEKAGVPISRTYLIYVNGDFVRSGEVLPEFRDEVDFSKGFFIKEDVTDEVQEIMDEIEAEIEKALVVLKVGEIDPKLALAKTRSKTKYKFLEQLDLKVLELLDVKIPEEEGEEFCDSVGIKKELDKLEYPLYYFDYETYSAAVPLFDGFHPYQQMPFQYSLHIQKELGGSVEHRQFLATEKSNPISALLTQMRKDLGDKGSVLVWYEAFEKSRNEEMAEMYPEYAEFLRTLNNERIYDLMKICKKGLFRKKEFGKSNSLKVVAPVLVPELPYAELKIKEGGEASESWLKLVDGSLSQAEKDDLYKDMLRYCERDTEVMVKIVDFLRKIIQ